MADVKFTGLPASSGTPDDGSLLAISTYDGVSAYNSEKYTITQAKAIFGNAPSSTDNAISRFDGVLGQIQDSLATVSDVGKVTAPSGFEGDSQTNEVVVSSLDSDYEIYFGSNTDNYKYWWLFDSNDGYATFSGVKNGIYWDEGEFDIRHTPTGWVQNSQEVSISQKISSLKYNASNKGSYDISMQKHQSGSSPADWSNEIYIEDNTNAYTKTNTWHSQFPVLLSATDITVNAGVTNSVSAGGTNYTVANNDTLYCDNFEHVGTDIGFFGATATTKPTITGSRAGNAALADLLTELATLGLITDSTTA